MAVMSTPGQTYRRYTDEERAAALAVLDMEGGNQVAAARRAGVSRSTLQTWIDGRVSSAVPELRQAKREDLTARLESILHHLLDGLSDPAALAAASLRDRAVAVGIVVDKLAILRGWQQPQQGPPVVNVIA